MIEWFTLAQVGIAVVAGLFCVVMGLAGRKPNDFTMGATAPVGLLPLVQLVAAIRAPARYAMLSWSSPRHDHTRRLSRALRSAHQRPR